MIRNILVGCAALSLMTGCGGESSNEDKIAKLIRQTERSMERCRRLMSEINSETDKETFIQFVDAVSKLDVKKSGQWDDEVKYVADSLQTEVDILKRAALKKIPEFLSTYKISYFSDHDRLLESKKTVALHMNRGEKLHLKLEAESPMQLRLYNADAKKLLKTVNVQKNYEESLPVRNTAIYLVELSTKTSQYVNFDVGYTVSSLDNLERKAIREETRPCSKTDFRAEAIKGIKMNNITEQPRKFTLRGQLKAAFSGSSRALVAFQVPAGTTDILYTMRIATSEQSRYSDGEFYNSTQSSYRKIKILGLPVYQSQHGSSLIGSILDDNRPVREEDAYCNMYVFRSSVAAKKFQDTNCSVANLQYDLDYSTQGTQSSNGCIPMKGARTIYLGFENERVRYANYLWVEAVAICPTTEYQQSVYSLE